MAIPARQLAAMPRGISFEHAAAIPLAGSTALQALGDRAFGNRSLRDVRPALEAGGVYVTTVPSRRVFLDTARTLMGHPRARLVVVRPRTERLARLARMVEEGRLRPQLDRVVPLEGAVEAVRHLESRHAHGKIVIRINTGRPSGLPAGSA